MKSLAILALLLGSNLVQASSVDAVSPLLKVLESSGASSEASIVHVIGIDKNGELCELSFGKAGKGQYVAMAFNRGFRRYADSYIRPNENITEVTEDEGVRKVSVKDTYQGSVSHFLEITVEPNRSGNFQATIRSSNFSEVCTLKQVLNNFVSDPNPYKNPYLILRSEETNSQEF